LFIVPLSHSDQQRFVELHGTGITPEPHVIRVADISLNETEKTLLVGDSETLVATITPENATNQNVTWSSSDESVVKVDDSPLSGSRPLTGQLTALKAGTATITVTTEDGGKTATCLVTVTDDVVYVTDVTLNKTTLELKVGESETITSTIIPANATNKNVTWSSSDETVVKVASPVSGLDPNSGGTVQITALKAGTATITVTTEDGGKTATCTVTVTPQTSVEIADVLYVRVYPNPTDGKLTLQFGSPVSGLDPNRGERFYNVTLTDMAGKVLLRQTVTDQTTQLDISNYPNGVYLLMIEDGKRKSTIRIVKN